MKKLFYLILILFISISCGPKKENIERNVIDGVTVVKNPKEPMYDEDVFTLEEELSIGDAKGKEQQMFTNILDIAVDDSEDIYILDSKQRQILVFNKSGNYSRNISRRGQGPGEFNMPFRIAAS